MIETAWKGTIADKKITQKLKRVKKAWPKQILRYEEQGAILGEGNSYSKTNQDATFMQMKEDYINNGQLKPGYNLQITTHDQFILNYSLHQTTADTNTYAPHMNGFHERYKYQSRMPDTAVKKTIFMPKTRKSKPISNTIISTRNK